MADVRFPEACEALERQIIWICRQKGGRGVRSVYLRHGSQSLGGHLLLFRLLLCSLQDVLQRQTNSVLFLQQKNSINKIRFFHRTVEKKKKGSGGLGEVCLCVCFWVREAVMSLSRGRDNAETTFLKAKHREVILRRLTMAFSSRGKGSVIQNVLWHSASTCPNAAQANCIVVTLHSFNCDTDLLSSPKKKTISKQTHFFNTP